MFPKMYNFAEYENWLFMVQWDKLFFFLGRKCYNFNDLEL